MLWHLLTSFFAPFILLKSFISFFCMASFAKCTNQDSNSVYVGTNLWHKRWYDTNMVWYLCNGRCRSLMCTSNVAGNTQMASLDRQVMQNGLGVNNAMVGGIYNGVVEIIVPCLRLMVSKGWDCSRCRSARSSVRWRTCRCTVGGDVKVAEIIEDVRTFCLSRKVLARRKVRGPEVPGWLEGPGVTGSSGGVIQDDRI